MITSHPDGCRQGAVVCASTTRNRFDAAFLPKDSPPSRRLRRLGWSGFEFVGRQQEKRNR